MGEVAAVVQAPQSTISRHLKTLAGGGWLAKRSEKTATYYRLHPDDLPDQLCSLWAAVREHLVGSPELDADLRRLQGVLATRRLDSRGFFGRVAGEWDHYRRELFGEHFAELGLLSLLPADWVVADLGCGTGNIAELIAPCVERVIAVDQSEPMLEAAQQRIESSPDGPGSVDLRLGELDALPIEDASVDACCACLALHHVDDADAAVREMARVLRADRGGGAALVIDMEAHDRHEFRQSMGHKHLGFSPQIINAMFGAAGFERPRIRYLPCPSDARGPGLFAASARIRDTHATTHRNGAAGR